MKHLHRILVAVDYSAPARAAFDRALALSRAHDAVLLAVHAVPANRGFRWDASERAELIATLRDKAQAAGVRFKSSVQQGDPASLIVLHANARQVDLIVMGTNERSALDRLRFGSVAETVALQATQPVLVVPAMDRDAGSVAPFSHILVAVDLSDTSGATIERALSMAGDNSRVPVVHVVPGLARAGASRYMYGLMEPEYQRQLARDARRRIAALIPAALAAPRQVHVRVVTGDPAAEISRVATDAGAGVILVGVTPRNAVGRRIFTSTAAQVMRTASVPVLALAA